MYKYNNLTHLLIGGGQSFFWKNHEGSFETPRDELRDMFDYISSVVLLLNDLYTPPESSTPAFIIIINR